MFPYKVPDPRFFRDCLWLAIFLDVLHCRSSNRYVVNVRLCYVWNFWLQYIADVFMKDWYQVCPAHWECGKSHRAEGCLECGIVLQ